MNGTGTAENPYIIMNVDDLYSMSAMGGNDVYFLLGADIDFGDTDYAENFVPITLNCKKFDGNGHMIRNVNYSLTDTTASMFMISETATEIAIENLKIENIRLAGTSVFLFGGSGSQCNVLLTHCTFILNDLITLSTNTASATDKFCLMHGNNIKFIADYCTFAIKVSYYKMYATFSQDSISHTQISAEIDFVSSLSTGNSYNAIYSAGSVSDSYFFMKIRNKSSITNIDLSTSSTIWNRSYFVFQDIRNIYYIGWNGTISSSCFYDKELLSTASSTSQVRSDSSSYGTVNIRALTTEQCKDAVYLRSIGFNCMGADEQE